MHFARVGRPRSLVTLLAAGLAAVVGCASPGPQALPPQTVTAPVETPSEPILRSTPTTTSSDEGQSGRSEARKGEDDRASAPEDDGSLLIVGDGTRVAGQTTTRDLIEASNREKERRRRSEQPGLVVTDDNLAEKAEGGRLTFAQSAPGRDDQVDRAQEVLEGYAEQEQYWRDRARTIRSTWREAYDRIDELEADASELRRRFYAEEDVALRDRDIKPAWDRTLELLKQARDTVDRSREELDLMMEEGRRAGALEGWLREGLELEPVEATSSTAADDASAFEPPPRNLR